MDEKYGKLNERFREKIKDENKRIKCPSQILEEHNKYYENLIKYDSQRQLRKHKYSVKQKKNFNRLPVEREAKRKELQKS